MSDNDRLIPTPQPADLVTHKVLIAGTELKPEYQVMTIDVVKVLDKVSYARIVLLDGDPAAQKFAVSDAAEFEPGKEIEIQAGYHSDNTIIFKGIILCHGLRIHGEKAGQLVIEARDKAVKLTGARRSAYYYKVKDSEIIEQLAGDAGLDKDVTATDNKHEEMVQYHCSDWDFLVSRAEMNGMHVLSDDNKLIVKKPDASAAATLKIEYGATLLDFEVDMNASTQFKTVKSHSWDYTEQALLESEGSNPAVKENGNITADTLADVLKVKEQPLVHPGKFTEGELKSWTDAQIVKNKLSRIRGRAKFQGFAGIKPGNTIELKGVGDRFNGVAFVSGIRHQLGKANWTTEVQFGFHHSWFYQADDILETPASGMVPAVHGLHIGVVTKIDADPAGEDRIQVKMPLLDNKAEGIWARISTLDAGKERGSFFRPEVGDEVLLGFINDDPRHPVVMGMMNSKKLPAPLQAAEANPQKGFITRSKIKLLFDDEKKIVTVTTPGEQSIVIDDDAGKVTIKDKNSNKIEMSSDGIVVESGKDMKFKASGDISFEGTNISSKASAQLKAEGSAGAELKAGGNMVVKGAMVQIN